MGFEIKKDPSKWFVCGTGQGWELVPKQTEATVICLNDYIQFERYQVKMDYLMLMDSLDQKPNIVSGAQNLGEVIARINALKVPLIAPYKYAEIPLSEEFPLEECVKEFGLPYFTNTICYMIAFALLKGAKEIQLFGVNQAGSHEYTEERSGVETWLGIAMGRGVRVIVNGQNSTLFRFKGRYGRSGLLYGYLAGYEEVLKDKQRFGESIIKKLIQPTPPGQHIARAFQQKDGSSKRT
jgi:hypothetical protein